MAANYCENYCIRLIEYGNTSFVTILRYLAVSLKRNLNVKKVCLIDVTVAVVTLQATWLLETVSKFANAASKSERFFKCFEVLEGVKGINSNALFRSNQ